MSPKLRRTTEIIDAISTWAGKHLGWLILPMIGCLVYEVFARYVFDRPNLWAYDMTYMLFGSHFMLGTAYALARGSHIGTDFFYRLWSPRWQGRSIAPFRSASSSRGWAFSCGTRRLLP